jgi:predicted glycosyl hydrolase (DUF1957 family)
MHIALLLHIYQPPTQYPYVVKKIARQSYERIVELLEKNSDSKITLNINASLTQQFKKLGLESLLRRISVLAQNGQVEFTASAAYHPVLPDLPRREIFRQINLNNSVNQSLLGSAYNPQGFFPPEMAYDVKLGKLIEEMGFKWIAVDDTAVEKDVMYLRSVYRRRGGELLAFPREDNLSFKIAFGKIKTQLGLVRAIGADNLRKRQYLVLAMDGETFGHHQPKQLKFLKRLFEANRNDKRVSLVTISELMGLYKKRTSVKLRESTWGYTEVVEGKKIWVRWRNPRNPVHKLLASLRSLALEAIDSKDQKARAILDTALNSDTFWWASGKPFWHPGMVKRGAGLFLKAINSSKASNEEKIEARKVVRKDLELEMKRMRIRKHRERILGIASKN